MSSDQTAGAHRSRANDQAMPLSGLAGFLTTVPGKITTAVLTAIAIGSAFIGSGALGGTPIAEAAGGVLDSDATWIAPAGPAFSIWSVIYAGLVAYTVWQLFPASDTARHTRLRPWILGGILLNSAWIWVIQAGWVGLSVVVIFLLLACLCRVLVLMERRRAHGWIELIVVDGTQGLYLGWVSIASVTNVAAWLASLGWSGQPLGAITWTVIVLVVAALVGAATAVYSRGRLLPALGLAWGLAWVAWGRAGGTALQSETVAYTAAGVAVVVLIVWAVARWRSR